ncbi:hypothetical protein BTK96_001052 [Burkholderia pyrrocinia]|nr:hypothetical protein [Burkholderia pyrrocinia]EKS9892803.1 hypothetical protein [Burkholderia pyrrocinia]EKS9907678.1 hypothetical protein [Burkholderia pyrrocinia]
MNELEAMAAPVPFQRPGAGPDADSAPHTAHAASSAIGADSASAGSTVVAPHAVHPGEQGAQAAEVGHGESAGDRAATSAHEGPAHGEAPAHSLDHAHDVATTGAETGADHHAHHIDLADPLAGLHSFRLRDSLEREAFRTADSIAQDSAIAERALSPTARALFERAQVISHESVPLDISRAAQDARITALQGEIPPFARGDPSLDPAIVRAMERSPSQSPGLAQEQARTQAPAESTASLSSQSPVATSSRVRDSGMEL